MLLAEIDVDFDFLGFTESCLLKTNFSPTNMSLAIYAIKLTPTESSAGGAVLYINLLHKVESVFVEVIMPKRTNVFVGCIYRHLIIILLILTQIMLASQESSKKLFLLCDFNIGLLKFNSCSSISIFWMSSHEVILHPKFFSITYNWKY